MPALLLSIALRLMVCAAVTYMAWLWLGAAAFATCAPLVGVLLARPLIDMAALLHHAVKSHALGHLSGRYFVHKGHSFEVVEDAQQLRWLRLGDVKKVMLGLPGHEVLARVYPGGVQLMGKPPRPCISVTALAELLQKSSDPVSLRFRVWLDRVVAHPTRRGQ
jgi:hypothetical protein